MTVHRLSLLLCALVVLGGCARRAQYRGWTLTVAEGHPLVGRIWDSRKEAFVRRGHLMRTAAGADYLLLGETHDHPDHHRIQAELLEAWLDAHPQGAVAFEQLDQSQGVALRQASLESADDVRRASRWEQNGWPDFELYRPLFELTLQPGAGPIAAHPDRATVRAAMDNPHFAPGSDLKLTPPPEDAAMASLRDEIIDSHCGHAPKDVVAKMMTAQRFKDAWMARAMVQARPAHVALITGSGHARTDRGVPMYLRRHGARDVLSVAILPVADTAVDPSDYPVQAYDFVVFTTQVSALSPCERFKEQLSHIRVRRSPRLGEPGQPPKSAADRPLGAPGVGEEVAPEQTEPPSPAPAAGDAPAAE